MTFRQCAHLAWHHSSRVCVCVRVYVCALSWNWSQETINGYIIYIYILSIITHLTQCKTLFLMHGRGKLEWMVLHRFFVISLHIEFSSKFVIIYEGRISNNIILSCSHLPLNKYEFLYWILWCSRRIEDSFEINIVFDSVPSTFEQQPIGKRWKVLFNYSKMELCRFVFNFNCIRYIYI